MARIQINWERSMTAIDDRTALLIIDVQTGLDDPRH